MVYRDLISEVITGEPFLGSVYFNTAEGSEGNIIKRTENVKSFVLQGYWIQLLLIDIDQKRSITRKGTLEKLLFYVTVFIVLQHSEHWKNIAHFLGQ